MATATPKPPDSSAVAFDRLSDRALFNRAAGDEAAFAELVNRYREPLRRHAARYVGEADAEDVVQQALVNASLAIRRQPDREIEPKPWLYKVTTNAAIDHRRAQSARPLGDRPHEEIDVDAFGEHPGGDPHEVATRRESVRSMVSGIRGLAPNQRRAATARFLEGRSHDEIASELGVSKGAARELIHRAKRNLREAIPALSPIPLFTKLKESLAALFAGSGSAGTAKLTAGAVVVATAGAGGVAIEKAVGGEDPAKPRGAAEAAAPIASVPDASPIAKRPRHGAGTAGVAGAAGVQGGDSKGGDSARGAEGAAGGDEAATTASAPPADGGTGTDAAAAGTTPATTGTEAPSNPVQDVADQLPVDQITDEVNGAVNEAAGAANDLGIGVEAPQLPDLGQALGGGN